MNTFVTKKGVTVMLTSMLMEVLCTWTRTASHAVRHIEIEMYHTRLLFLSTDVMYSSFDNFDVSPLFLLDINRL